ncbi:MAG: glycosyltransferase [Planctomycetota bacterium]|jgi:FkbM family methyltransferase
MLFKRNWLRSVKNDDVNIIIPFYNDHVLLSRCLRSVEASGYKGGKIVIVNDGSEAEEVRIIERLFPDLDLDILLISHDKNKGFRDSILTGIRQCDCKYVILLNSDTVVTPNFAGKLIDIMIKNRIFKAVAPTSNHPTDLYQFRDKLYLKYQFDDDDYRKILSEFGPLIKQKSLTHRLKKWFTNNYITVAPFLTGCCLALDKEIFEKAGYFHGKYDHGYFEDMELSCRIRDLGYKLAVNEDCFVFHRGQGTYGKTSTDWRNKLQWKNYFIFKDAWGHYPEFEDLDKRMQWAGLEYPLVQETLKEPRPPIRLSSESLLPGPLVTVGILAYNRPEGLKDALTDITNQSYSNLEIIISDDCSNDPEVAETANKFALKDSRITYIQHTKNMGIIKNHEFLLSRAKGKYMMWAADDDRWHTDYIKVCAEALEQNPKAVLCVTNCRVLTNDIDSDWEYVENIHTLHEEVKLNRFRKVLNNSLWWNSGFYGIYRCSAIKDLKFRTYFGFDNIFIIHLSLIGEFIKLSPYYFKKRLEGVGSQLESNLKAITANNGLAKRFPRMGFCFEMIKEVWAVKSLGQLEKCKMTLSIINAVASEELYSDGRGSVVRKLKEFPLRFYLWRKFKRINDVIGNLNIIDIIYEQSIPENEFEYNKQTRKLRLAKLNIFLQDPDQIYLLNGYNIYIYLARYHEVFFSQDDDGRIFVKVQGITIWLKDCYYGNLIDKVFIRNTYNVHLTKQTVVFDIGVNVGLSALFFARNKFVKKVIGFELFQPTLNEAIMNFELNHDLKKKIETHAVGLAEEESETMLEYAFKGSYVAGIKGIPKAVSQKREWLLKWEKVKFLPASAAIFPHLERYQHEQRVLKIACEGGEYIIINNLDKNNLLKEFSFILVEWHKDDKKNCEKIINALQRNNFLIFSTDYQFNFERQAERGMIYASRSE